jgi:hypothetical protein
MTVEHDPSNVSPDNSPDLEPDEGSAPVESPSGPVEPSAGDLAAETGTRDPSRNMLPQRDRRRSPVESLFVRLVATAGIVAIGVAIAAIMVSSNSKGWLIGLVVSIVSVVLAAILWSSRQL